MSSNPTHVPTFLLMYMKEPYHTSILSGYAWLQELLHGHPEHICTELGVLKEVFHALIRELQSMGHGDMRYVTLEEQLAIFPIHQSQAYLYVMLESDFSIQIGQIPSGYCNHWR